MNSLADFYSPGYQILKRACSTAVCASDNHAKTPSMIEQEIRQNQIAYGENGTYYAPCYFYVDVINSISSLVNGPSTNFAKIFGQANYITSNGCYLGLHNTPCTRSLPMYYTLDKCAYGTTECIFINPSRICINKSLYGIDQACKVDDVAMTNGLIVYCKPVSFTSTTLTARLFCVFGSGITGYLRQVQGKLCWDYAKLTDNVDSKDDSLLFRISRNSLGGYWIGNAFVRSGDPDSNNYDTLINVRFESVRRPSGDINKLVLDRMYNLQSSCSLYVNR
jgi:hypothetical protein